jgi:hypothetical protein
MGRRVKRRAMEVVVSRGVSWGDWRSDEFPWATGSVQERKRPAMTTRMDIVLFDGAEKLDGPRIGRR